MELSQPVPLENVMTNDIILLKVDSDEAQNAAFLKSIKDGVNTNTGMFGVIVSDKNGDPLNPQIINLNINDITEIWER